MNFTQNTLNIYNNYLFKHCNAVVPLSHLKLLAVHRRIYGDLVCCMLLCVYSMLSAMRRRIWRVPLVCASHIKHYVQPLITFTNKLMPLIFQYNFIANTFGLILFVN